MALTPPWYPWHEATLSDAAPIAVLMQAVRERMAVVSHALIGANLQPLEFLRTEPPPHAIPTIEYLEWIRRAILLLAPYFVRLDADSYVWHSWRNFPVAYSASDAIPGGQSIAVYPEIHVAERDASGLAAYRAFLAACQEWLMRFRYVRADALASCDRYVDHVASMSAIETALSSVPWTQSGAYAKIAEIKVAVERGISKHGGSPTPYTWDDATSVTESAVMWLSGSAGMRVRNPAGVPAKCLVLPIGGDTSDSFGKHVSNIQTTDGCAIVRYDDPEDPVVFGVYGTSRMETVETYRLGETANKRALLHSIDTTEAGLSIADGDATWTRTEYELEFAVAEDFSWSRITNENAETRNRTEHVGALATPFQGMFTQRHSITLADSMGCGTLGTPIDAGEIAPHDEIEAFSAPAELSPDTSSPDSYLPLPVATPSLSNSSSVSASYECRFFPILDYGPYFRYRPADGSMPDDPEPDNA